MAKKVLIEMFTLDSAGCAPCTYAKEAVEEARDEIGGEIEIIEHKIKDKAAVKLMQERGVKKIPTICINGDIVYESLIPPNEELIAEIKKRMQEADDCCCCGGDCC
ncbi:MAG: arsenic metallochaperone ArsD family protein [Clostridia bacterium]|nr:arsenic metallochaperone ArsD family protein [Clostridia bacterium]